MKKLFTLLVIFTFFVSALSVAQIQKKGDEKKMDLKKKEVVQDNTKVPLNQNTLNNSIFPNNPMSPDAVAPYTFVQTAGTYTAIAGTSILAASTDDASSTIQNIGFNFTYNGIIFTTFGAQSNGYITLGAVSGQNYTPLSALSNCIAFAGGDGRTGGDVTYILSGSSPNQVLTIQFPSWNIYYGSVSDYVDAQIKLYETTNVIEIVYGTSGRLSSFTRQVGITGAVTSDYSIRTLGSSWAATIAGAANTATMTWSTGYYPASGQVYRWTPPSGSQPPTVTTTVVTVITATTALSGGNVTSDGGAGITARGVCWSTLVNPTTSDPKTTESGTIGAFTSTLTPLLAATTYHVRAYATNSQGTSYGSDIAFTTSLNPISSFPWTEPFTNWPPIGFSLTGGTVNWAQYTTTASYCNFWNWQEPNNAIMTTPPLNLSSLTNPNLEFKWSHQYMSSYPNDQLQVSVSTNYGSSWTIVWDKSGTNLNSNDGAGTTTPGTYISSGNTSLASFAGQTILISFNGVSGYGPDLFVDYVTVGETPLNPIFSINPSSNAFGNVSVGGSSVQTFTISNAGGSTLTINSSDFTLTGADQTQFQIFGASTLNLTSGQTGTVGVQYVPTTPGSKSANLHIVDNIPSAHDIALTGSGILNAPQTLIGGLNSSFKPSLSWQTPLTGEVKIDDGTVEQTMYIGFPSTTNQLFFNKMVAPHNGTISQIGIYSVADAANLFNSVMLCPDDGTGKPNLASPYATFSNVAVGVSYSWIFLTLPAPQSVTAGQTFYIVTQWPAGSSTGPYIGADNTIPNGRSYWTQDGGTTWNAWAANWLMRAYMGTYSGKLISGCTPGEMKLLKPTSVNDLKKKTDISVRKRIEKPISVPAALIYGANGDKVLSNYTVKRGTTSGTYTLDFTGISALTYTDNSAVLGNTYYYVVDAVYTEGTSSHSNEVIVTALNPNYGTFVLNGAGDFYKFSNNTNNGNPGGNEKPTYEWYPTTDFTPITFADNDDGNTQVSFPGQFFRFFDTDYSSVYVNVNGYLTFGGGATDWSPAGPLPQAGDPANMIAAAFRDLYVRTSFSPASNVSYKIFTDKIVISYENIYHISASDGQNYISFQIILIASSSTPSINSLYVINYNDEMSYAPLNTNTIVLDASIGTNGPSGSYGYNYRYAGVKGPMFSGVTLGPNGANSLSLGFVDFNAPLPVSLSSFSSSLKGRDVKLTWTTEKEINNSGFDVERKTDANSLWSKVGYVKGSGSTNLPVNYTFEDKKLNSGKYNYRLKQIDYNGNFEYHNLTSLVDVSLPTKFNLSQNYPNPFNPITKIDFDLPFDSKVNIILFDMTGREVKTLVNESRTAGFHTVAFNASDLSSGMYFYRFITKSAGKDFVATKKMMLIK